MHYQHFTSLITILRVLSVTKYSVEAFRRHPSSFVQNHIDVHPTDLNANVNANESETIDSPSRTDRLLLHSRQDGTGTENNDQHEIERNSIIQQTVQSTIDEAIDRDLSSSSSSSSLPKPSDHLITSLPYLDPDTLSTKQYAGHIPASSDDDKKIFYWMFEPDTTENSKKDEEIPLLIWLNGGPGCSSMDGLFLENGPLRLVKDNNKNSSDKWTMQTNPQSWHKAPAYVLYIDQPVGTGLSFTKKGKYCKNDLEVNIDFHLFLENFLLTFSDLFLKDGSSGDVNQKEMKRPVYFSGESHAGHYIPSMMDYILKRNDDTSKMTSPRVKIDLTGAAIGNGWFDPYYQYAAADLAYSIGLIDLAQKQVLDDKEEKCREKLQDGELRSGVCFDLLDKIVDDASGNHGDTTLSIYDNRKWEKRNTDRTFPPGHKDVEAYLGGWYTMGRHASGMEINYEDVLKALHAEESIGKQRFKECTDPPYNALSHQDGLGVTKEVVNILSHGTKPKLLFFNGMNDMICNHVGNEKALDNLEWEHIKEWTLAKRSAWVFDSDFINNEGGPKGPAGYIKEYQNLMFLKIASSGHMVPMDLPDVALEMMRKLMFQKSFGGNNAQSLGRSIPNGNNKDCPFCPTCTDSSTMSTEANTVSHDDFLPNEKAEEDEATGYFTRQFLMGMWSGGVVGIGIILIFKAWKSKRSSSQFDLARISNDNGYSDDPETEMVISSRVDAMRDVEGEYT